MIDPKEDLLSSVIVEHFNQQAIAIRKDGYWNLTQMCGAYGKRVNDFLRLESTQRYLNSLNKRLTVTETGTLPAHPATEVGQLVEVIQGGLPELQGTWGHRRVALKLAAWLNSDLEVWVYEVIEKLLVQGEVKLKDELVSLQSALARSKAQLNETRSLLEETSNELALTSHQLDKALYDRDELAEIAQFRRENCWEAEAEYLDDGEASIA